MKMFLKCSLVTLWGVWALMGAVSLFSDWLSPESRNALRILAALPTYICGWFYLMGWLKV